MPKLSNFIAESKKQLFMKDEDNYGKGDVTKEAERCVSYGRGGAGNLRK